MSLQQATEWQSVNPSRATGGGDHGRRRPGATAISIRRADGPDFSASFFELQDVVRQSCGRQPKWEAKVVAGLDATLSFCAEQPAKARALTLSARRLSFGDRNPEQVVIAYFAGELRSVAPRRKRVELSTVESIVESVAVMVRGHLLGGDEKRLPAIAPDLVYLALLPYLGLDEATRWAQRATDMREGG